MNRQVFPSRPRSPGRFRAAALLSATVAAGCAAASPELPDPRPIVIYSGARIRVEKARMDSINAWVTREQTNIEQDPAFWVIVDYGVDEVYPWEGMRLGEDTVRMRIDPRATDSRLVFEIYGHLHLMTKMGRQEEFLPEAPTATGFDLEQAILARTADAWLLGRAVFDTTPYGPLDELMYAKEAGYLDAFIFTARPNEFAEARADWARAKPQEADEYRNWFVQTFNRDPPGLRTK